MQLYYAGEYLFSTQPRMDLGIVNNRLLSYDYQNKLVDKLQEQRERVILELLSSEGEKSLVNKIQYFNLYLGGLDKFGREEVNRYMQLYLVGPEKPNIMQEVHSSNVNMLFNYLDGKKATDAYKEQIKPGKLFIDSGAFSAWTKGSKIDVKEYINWLNERADYIDLCGQVDFIPGDRVFGATPAQVKEAAEKTWQNYLFMRKRLKNPDALLYTFHVGEPMEFLKNALKWQDENGEHLKYIALGGMVGKPHKIRDIFLEKCFKVIKSSPVPDIKVHAFGMTDFDLLEKYPIYSADSTSWIMVGAMGNIMTDFGSISVSSQQKNSVNHYSHLPNEQIDSFNEMISRFGFTLDQLAENRDDRILFNAKYMQEKVNKLNSKSRSLSFHKNLF